MERKNKMKKWHKPAIQKLSVLKTAGGTNKAKAEDWGKNPGGSMS